MNGQIAVVGSLNMDLVIRTPRMPLPGETIKGYDFHVIPGGKGANQAVAAARQGAHVTMIGRIGADDFGQAQQRCLRQENIDLAFLTIDPAQATGVAIITLDEAGQNSIILSPGANGTITPQHINTAQEAITRAKMLIGQLEIPLETVTCAIECASAQGVAVLLNPAPAYPLEQALLAKVTYLILNETEASLLTELAVKDIDTAKAAARQLQQLGVKTVILTLGENGAIIAHAGACWHEPAVTVTVVDTTAAGDAFVGSFAVAVTEGQSVREAARFATHAAALAVTKLGAQPSLPTRPEVARFMARSSPPIN